MATGPGSGKGGLLGAACRHGRRARQGMQGPLDKARQVTHHRRDARRIAGHGGAFERRARFPQGRCAEGAGGGLQRMRFLLHLRRRRVLYQAAHARERLRGEDTEKVWQAPGPGGGARISTSKVAMTREPVPNDGRVGGGPTGNHISIAVS